MARHSTEATRNIAVVGHVGSGKTTLMEGLLAKAGVIGAPGSVEKGDTVCDFDPEEVEHGHSLNSAVVGLGADGSHVNLIDTPGMPDFMGHALAALTAVETAAVVVNAQNGVEMMTRRLMERAAERGLARLIVINKIDAENVDLAAVLGQVREAFGNECLPINLPAGGAKKVVDVFDHASGDSDFSSVAEAHTQIVDQVVEVDEGLMEKYLEQGEVSAEELHEPFEKCLREGHLIPICFTSAKEGAGLGEVLKIFSTLMPNPKEANRHPLERVRRAEGAGAGGEGNGKAETAEALAYEPDPSAPALCHVFKVTTDPFVGKLSVFRVHRGTVRKDTQLHISGSKKPFKVSHLFALHGKEHKEVEAAVTGDIAAVAKVEEISFDDVLHESAEDGDVRLRPAGFPMPMAGYAIEAASRGDEAKISKALHAMEAEDPCFAVETSSESKQTVIRGLGELHLRVMLEKMKNRYNVEVQTHPPKIAYRETIQGKAEGHHRHKKQTGGAGQFGEVYLRVEPLERGAGFEFSNDTFGGSIPSQLVPAVEKGVRQVLAEGAIAGYTMQDLKVSVYDGKYHPVDSKEVAFVTAARKAFVDAVSKAKPTLLEPMVDMEITVPEANMGDIAGDLSGKRGRIQGTETLPGGMIVIRAQAPLAELGQYQSQLKSVTGGQGSFTMSFSHYEPVPPNVQQQLVSGYKPREEE